MEKLTEKQLLFCKHYLITKNATQSAIKAGYSEKTAAEMGYENLRKPHIREFIDEELKKVTDKLDVTVEDVARGIWDLTQKCADSEDTRTFNPSAALKGFELIGKHRKMFSEGAEGARTVTVMPVITLADGKPLQINIGEPIEPEAQT